MAEYVVPGVPYVSQNNDWNCWEASYRMLLGYKGRNQNDTKNLPNYQKILEDGMKDEYLLPCRQFFGLASTSSSYFSSIENIDWDLKKYGPIWCDGRFWSKNGWHVVVLVGYRTNLVSEDEVAVHDPWTGYKSRTMEGPRWWGLGYFKTHLNPHAYSCQHWG